MKRVAIIGAGVSGLAAAFCLEQARRSGATVEYQLFEAGSRLGGVLLSERVDDCVVEAGPDSFLTEKTWAADFCREIGIGDQLIGSNDSARKTYILRNGTSGADARRTDVYGADQNPAGRCVFAFFFLYEIADGPGVVSSG